MICEGVTKLRERLTNEARREGCVQACTALVDRELAARKGLGGAAIKTGVSLLKKVRPTLIPDAMERLIPHFADSLDPWWTGAEETPARFSSSLQAEPSAVADALLKVTDERIEGAHDVVRQSYAKMRKGAKVQVERSVPGIAQTLAEVLNTP